jgi:hypothetical protein
MSGYNIDQLLRWTLEDQLIDGYAFGSDDDVEISRSGRVQVMKRHSAEQLLRELIGRISEEPEALPDEPEIPSLDSEKPAGDP